MTSFGDDDDILAATGDRLAELTAGLLAGAGLAFLEELTGGVTDAFVGGANCCHALTNCLQRLASA